MKISYTTKTLVAAVLASLSLGAAAEGLSFNIGAVSLYKYRGVDQDAKNKDFRPAIQGGVDYAFANGFYVGNWNSTGTFGNARLEIDLYAGHRGQITERLSYDVGYIHYFYPQQKSWNSGEVYAGLSHGPISGKVFYGTKDGVNKGFVYTLLGYTLPLSEALSLKATVGVRNQKAGDFADYSLGLSYDMGNNLTVSGTLAAAAKRAAVTDGSRDARLVLGVTKSF